VRNGVARAASGLERLEGRDSENGCLNFVESTETRERDL